MTDTAPQALAEIAGKSGTCPICGLTSGDRTYSTCPARDQHHDQAELAALRSYLMSNSEGKDNDG